MAVGIIQSCESLVAVTASTDPITKRGSCEPIVGQEIGRITSCVGFQCKKSLLIYSDIVYFCYNGGKNQTMDKQSYDQYDTKRIVILP